MYVGNRMAKMELRGKIKRGGLERRYMDVVSADMRTLWVKEEVVEISGNGKLGFAIRSDYLYGNSRKKKKQRDTH